MRALVPVAVFCIGLVLLSSVPSLRIGGWSVKRDTCGRRVGLWSDAAVGVGGGVRWVVKHTRDDEGCQRRGAAVFVTVLSM